MQLYEGELRGAIDRHKKVELFFFGANLGDIDVKVAYRIGLELLLCWLVAFDLGPSADAVALETAMQGGTSEMGQRRLERVEAMI